MADDTIPLDDASWWQDPYPTLSEIRDQHRTGVTAEGLKAILRWEDAEDLLKSDRFENEGLEYIERRGFAPGDALYEWRPPLGRRSYPGRGHVCRRGQTT